MKKFLEIYSLPKLSQEEIDNLNRLITRSKIETIIKKKKNLSENKSPGTDGYTVKFHQTYKEELILAS